MLKQPPKNSGVETPDPFAVYDPTEGKVSTVVCRNEECGLHTTRFPLTGIEDISWDVMCPECSTPLSKEFGEPLPVIYLDMILGELDAFH